ncbi:MAG: hypothetical protein ABS52_18145 [Gemmatimonadetes bacterium SCN 70-22]|nr:MAG: hypothetical protein ABS52_18145 [Gemmatimonadetes bacterium SCN 70-22]
MCVYDPHFLFVVVQQLQRLDLAAFQRERFGQSHRADFVKRIERQECPRDLAHIVESPAATRFRHLVRKCST